MNGPDRGKANRRTVTRLSIAAAAMFGFGYALIPMYNAFCEITGLNGKTGRSGPVAIAAPVVQSERRVTVEFLANLDAGLAWEFQPKQAQLQVQPGVFMQATYLARNTTSQTITGQAVPSVAPGQAARYFNKAECFCFTQQTLGPGETREMLVKFVVDPKLPERIKTVTLSYTFFVSEKLGSVALSQR